MALRHFDDHLDKLRQRDLHNLLRWLLVLLGGAVSSIFLLSNFHAHLADCFPYGEGDAKKKTYSLLGLMLLFHIILVFMFKVSFFKY